MYHPATPPDDQPEWVRKIVQQHWYNLPHGNENAEPDAANSRQTVDTQRRCVICEALLMFDAADDVCTCTAHRLFEILRQNVLIGSVTEWPASLDSCGTGARNHIRAQREACLVHWLSSVKFVIARYNRERGTRYHFI